MRLFHETLMRVIAAWEHTDVPLRRVRRELTSINAVRLYNYCGLPAANLKRPGGTPTRCCEVRLLKSVAAVLEPAAHWPGATTLYSAECMKCRSRHAQLLRLCPSITGLESGLCCTPGL